MKSYIKFIFSARFSMKITGQMSADGALEVSKMLAVAAQILAVGLSLAALIWVIRWW